MIELNDLQKLVVKHYEKGEYNHARTMGDAFAVSDTLFHFALLEAQDAQDWAELVEMLQRAKAQLTRLACGLIEELDK